ncbi:MAG TPA: nucleotide exchange factor GrpE, partial [Pyrinomonadaceae bacterium]
MNPKEQIPRPEESIDEIVDDTTTSVDDFIRELEAKERDLHITADLTIEVEQSEFDARIVPDVQVHKDVSSNIDAPVQPHGSAMPGLKTRVFELEREVESLHERVRELKAERNEIQEKSDRRLKDFESFKYRMDRERRGAFIDQIANLAAEMLPVLDNLDRALASVGESTVDGTDEFRKFYDGIALVNQQVNEVIGEMGV